MDLNDRLKLVVKHLIKNGFARNQKELGVMLGYSNESSFSQVVNGKVPFPKDFISKIKNLDGSINGDWVEHGVGDMVGHAKSMDDVDFSCPPPIHPPCNETDALMMALSEIKEQRRLVAKSQEQIDRLIGIIEGSTTREV